MAAIEYRRTVRTVKRYWYRQSRRLDVEAALHLAEAGFATESGLETLGELSGARCLVLLGPPGVGKSTDIENFASMARLDGVPVQLEDLREFTSDDRLLTVSLDGEAASSPAEMAHLILDSFEEAPLSTSTLARLILRIAGELPSHVRLVLVCRAAAWKQGLTEQLRQRCSEVVVAELAPLTRDQAVAVAACYGASPSTFKQFATATNTWQLTQFPVLVKMLALEAASASTDEVEELNALDVFDRGSLRLVADPDDLRSSAFPPHRLRACAGALAAIALLTGVREIRLGEGPPEEGILYTGALQDLAVHPRTELLGERFAFDDLLAAAALQTSVFRPSGQGHWFVQQTITEYLAASALLRSPIEPDQLQLLLRGHGGLLPSQVQGLTAWLVGLAPDQFEDLIAEDPVSMLLSGAEIIDPSMRKKLTKAIFELGERYLLPSNFQQADLRALRYEGVSEDLRDYIRGSQHPNEVRFLAIRLARSSRSTASIDDLLAVCLDVRDDVWVRNSAGHALIDLGQADVLARELLNGLLQHDEDDQMLGLALIAALRSASPLSTLVGHLKAPDNEDLFGSYQMALSLDMPAAVTVDLPPDEMLLLLEWALENDAQVVDASPRARGVFRDAFAPLTNKILLTAAIVAEGDVRLEGLVRRFALARIEGRHRLISRRGHRSGDSSEIQEAKRPLLRILSKEQEAEIASRYWTYVLMQDLAVGERDFRWLAEESLSSTSDSEAGFWAELADWVFDIENPEHRDYCLLSDADTRLYALAFAKWREPVELESEFATMMRQRLADERDAKEDDGPTPNFLREKLKDALDDGGPRGWLTFCHWLSREPGSSSDYRSFESDLRQLPAWSLIETGWYPQISQKALEFLNRTDFDPSAELGTNRVSAAGMGAVFAATWLLTHRPEALTASQCEFWAPAFIHCPTNNWEDTDLLEAMRRAYAANRESFLRHVSKELMGEGGNMALRRVAGSLDAHSISWLRSTVESVSSDDAVAAQAFTLLAGLDAGAAREALERLTSEGQENRAESCVVGWASHDLAAAWPMLAEVLEDEEQGQNALLALSERSFPSVEPLGDEEVGWLWERFMTLLPSASDPDVRGVHAVGPREAAAHVRDQLLPTLAQRGTPSALAELQSLAERHADEPALWRLVSDAQRARVRDAWKPIDSAVLLRMWSGSAGRILATSDDLLEVVEHALREIQSALQDGENPEATMLWNHRTTCGAECRPKSEDDLNDYTARRLRERLPAQVISREVEVNRNSQKGIGQRPDLLISAVTPQGIVVNVVVEGKGSWNSEVKVAADNQLRRRYMARYSEAAGLLLVYWFGAEHFRGNAPKWAKDQLLGDRSRLATFLAAQTSEVSEPGRPVHAIIMDLSLTW